MATYALAPFDHAEADVILRSADGVDFRVFRLFLSLAPPFFKTMFSLPQVPGGATDEEMKDGLAVIVMSEDSKNLDTFLRFCYPSTLADDPSLENLTEVLSVLATARKFSMDLIERKVRQALENPNVLETDPLRFVLARNAGLEHETIIAARYTLQQPLIPAWLAEMELITASDLLALQTYHKNCSIAVQASVKDLKWIRHHYGSENGCTWLFGLTSYDAPYPCECEKATDQTMFPWGVRAPVAWCTTYMQETFELLMERPCGDTVRKEVGKTIQKVISANCTTCSDGVHANMTEFSNLLALEVEKVVALVELQMDF